jgi:predicted ABC-type ATPase
MEGNSRPALWLMASADGVGKTTYTRARIATVSGTTEFVNLDLIAQGMSPLNPAGQQTRAARYALEMARDLNG